MKWPWVSRREMERVLRILKAERVMADLRFHKANALPLDDSLRLGTLSATGEVAGLSVAIGCLGGALEDS
ncbi:hypothetical protein LCGC14_3028240 [marine sediment metagenome]|uniref:Uncharacterized protein n=1 Tax=marine sediment metagenome TaxID=412755 RepID=A0A0F8XGD5_9ZZZZ